MRRDGESRSRREAGERDLVIKSKVGCILGDDRFKKRWIDGGECQRRTYRLHARAGARSHAQGCGPLGRGVSGGGGAGGTWVLGYLAAEPVRTLAGTLPPGTEHGGAARWAFGTKLLWGPSDSKCQKVRIPGQARRGCRTLSCQKGPGEG